jgi:hypothetical protein
VVHGFDKDTVLENIQGSFNELLEEMNVVFNPDKAFVGFMNNFKPRKAASSPREAVQFSEPELEIIKSGMTHSKKKKIIPKEKKAKKKSKGASKFLENLVPKEAQDDVEEARRIDEETKKALSWSSEEETPKKRTNITPSWKQDAVKQPPKRRTNVTPAWKESRTFDSSEEEERIGSANPRETLFPAPRRKKKISLVESSEDEEVPVPKKKISLAESSDEEEVPKKNKSRPRLRYSSEEEPKKKISPSALLASGSVAESSDEELPLPKRKKMALVESSDDEKTMSLPKRVTFKKKNDDEDDLDMVPRTLINKDRYHLRCKIPVTLEDLYFNQSKIVSVKKRRKNEYVVHDYVIKPALRQQIWKEHGDMSKDGEAGDLIIETELAPNKEYYIQGQYDLVRIWKVSLYEYIFTSEIEIEFLGKRLPIKRDLDIHKQDLIVVGPPSNTFIYANQGLLKNPDTGERGDLIIKLTVLMRRDTCVEVHDNLLEFFPPLVRNSSVRRKKIKH